MGKYVSIFFLTIIISIFLFFLFANFISGEGDEGLIVVIGIINVVLTSFLISLIYYLIDLIKKNIRERRN
ncbi:hypothetical protein [Lysinibacillus telephonicus]|uniref:Uncharacterized protein n=1 Tax=Lysinibacillus telephonicus TaxID=1714840 RepID=A0A3S0HEQ4_9BACI|nr:hypothetical protein [Lysinibacillus telephonicus]RTQ86934.1 hypothetical protein EKG35_19685 [Lysinibacillus telephonicus]